MIVIDGSMGEGGGQIVRTSLALSLITARPFSVRNIRAGRKKPGLLRQHLIAVNAAAEIGQAEVSGNEIGSREMTFTPGAVKPGAYRFSVGTAGSATLVLQTVLPALAVSSGPSEIVLEGGTHNPAAPPYDFLERVFLPWFRKMGPKVSCSLERPGYYPAGGGRFTVTIEPAVRLAPLQIPERGEIRKRHARAVVCRLPEHIARRELETVRKMLNWDASNLETVVSREFRGPGNVLMIEMEFEHITEMFTGFGERGVTSEEVAEKACRQAREYLASGAPVGRYLADQLLLPLAMAGKGGFLTLAPSRHTMTNIEVIAKFLDVNITCTPRDERAWQVLVG